MKKVLFFNYFFVVLVFFVYGQDKVYKFPPVKYVSLIKDISEYYLYANGGFDADWYIGYNNAWIINLGPIDTTGFKKAYIGVKLGRAKNKSYPKSDDIEPFEGRIMISISQSPVFPSYSYVLCELKDIPMEPIESESLKKVDSSKWFWTEIPLNKISSVKDNYIAVWANAKELTSSAKSPIIAAGYLDDGIENVWINHSIRGSMPSNETACEMAVSGIKPAIVIKLVPENDYKVVIKNFDYFKEGEKMIFSWNAIGTDIYKSWIEISYDRLEWKPFTNYLYSPPYFISYRVDDLPKDIFYLRSCAQDVFENVGCSSHISINLLKKED